MENNVLAEWSADLQKRLAEQAKETGGDEGNLMMEAACLLKALSLSAAPQVVGKGIGETIQVRRDLARLTQEELALRVGVSQQTIAKWESGKAVPRPHRYAKLAEWLNISITRKD